MDAVAFILVAFALAVAVGIAIVRGIRRTWSPTPTRELLVAVVRGLFFSPSGVAAGHGALLLPTIGCIPFWISEPRHFTPLYFVPAALFALLSLAASADVLVSRSPASALRGLIRIGIWLPVVAWLVALVALAINPPAPRDLYDYRDWTTDVWSPSSFITGVAGFGVFLLVLAASIGGLRVLKGTSASRAQVASVMAGLVISVAYLVALPIFHSVTNAQENRLKSEHGALVSAIWNRDLPAFNSALAARKHLPIDAPLMYHVLLFSIDRRLEDMAVELVKAGTPLLLNKQLHPELRVAIQRRADHQHDRPTSELVAGIMAVASATGLADSEVLAKGLSEVTINLVDKYPPSRNMSARNLNSDRIQNDPQIGFAASLSQDALQAAVTERRFATIETRNANNETVLFFALRDEKQCEKAPDLLRNGVDVHAANILGVTPLMLAAGNCGNDMVLLLLEKRVDVNAVSNDGSTALMYASVAGQSKNVQRLLTAGARAKLKTHSGETALSMARQQRFDDVVKLLEQASR